MHSWGSNLETETTDVFPSQCTMHSALWVMFSHGAALCLAGRFISISPMTVTPPFLAFPCCDSQYISTHCQMATRVFPLLGITEVLGLLIFKVACWSPSNLQPYWRIMDLLLCNSNYKPQATYLVAIWQAVRNADSQIWRIQSTFTSSAAPL